MSSSFLKKRFQNCGPSPPAAVCGVRDGQLPGRVLAQPRTPRALDSGEPLLHQVADNTPIVVDLSGKSGSSSNSTLACLISGDVLPATNALTAR